MGKPFIPNQWMLSEWDGQVKRMVQLYSMPNPHLASQRRLNITMHLNETKLRGTDNMRLVFNTTLTVDVASHDDELRKAFIELVSTSARNDIRPRRHACQVATDHQDHRDFTRRHGGD